MYQWIDDCLKGLVDLYETKDIYEIYECLEIQIIKLEKDNILLQGNEALYHRDYLGHEIVFIRNDLSPGYEKFVLAHELGHAVLHTSLSLAAFNQGFHNSGKYEKQADYFAIKLMDVKLDEVELQDLTAEQISNYLDVPKKLIEYKLSK